MKIISEFRSAARYWWIFIVSGTLLILFGLLIFNHPIASFAELSVFFAATFIVNGLLEIAFACSNYRSVHGWGWHLAGGIFDLTIGGILLANPILAAVSLPLFAGFWLMFRSIAIIGRCFDLPAVWPEQAWMGILGIAGLVSSFMILYNPALGVFSVVVWTTFALVSIGLFYLFLGLHLKKLNK